MKKLLLSLLVVLFSLSRPVIAEPITIARDLAKDASISLAQNRPIVFFVTADHCPYCEKLRQEYFKFSTGDERFLLRELELDEYHSVVGFDGKTINHQLLADRYQISLTPTVAFVGPDGEKLAESLVGVPIMDFYNYYFEKALGESISKLKEEPQKLAQN
jgi:thioredoxin-related protein